MKSKIKLCLLAVAALSVAAAAAGCAGGGHTHTYSDAWAFDAQSHWHPASCEHDAKINKSEHAFETAVIAPNETDGGYTLHICACGYSYKTDPTDPVPGETPELGGYRFDAEQHWKPAASGEDLAPQPHRFEEEEVSPTCYAAGYTKHVCECGYWYASDPIGPVAHTYGEGVLEHDESAHWRTCLVCGIKNEIAPHNFAERITPATCDAGGYTDFTCKDCGYSYRGREVAAGHTFAETLASDEFEHWRPATCGHTAKADVAEHVFADDSGVCAVCGKEIAPRISYTRSADGSYYIVTGIGNFKGEEIVIPDEVNGAPVREIAASAFRNNPDITSVTCGKNVEKIGAHAFEGTKLTAAELGSAAVGQRAFADCKELQTVTFETAGTVAPYAFENCTSLQSVTCTSPLTEVGAQAFNGCVKLQALDLSKCTSVGFSAFGGCAAFAPSSLEALVSAEEYAFSESGIAQAVLPAALQVISDNLFNGCEKLVSVTTSAAEIGVSAFEGCTLLSSVTLSGTKYISGRAFKGCAALSSLALPESVLRVGADAFGETGLITEKNGGKYAANVLIGASVGTMSVEEGTVGIADEAFKGNKTLTAITLADSVRFIGVDAFRGCEGLSAIDFKNVKIIGANSFRESGLESVTVPATVESVGDNAFYDCKSLTSVSVSAKEIGRFAFSYTGEGRTLDSPVKQRPGYAKLASVTIGEGVESIGSNAFQYCPVKQITLPESLVSIGKYAFAQTDLTEIAIPAEVSLIGEYAFFCNLTSATFAKTSGWKAGKTALTLTSPASNATYLTSTYLDIDWIRG